MKNLGCGLVLAVLLIFTRAASAESLLANVNPVAADFGAVKMGATVSVPVTVSNLSNAVVGVASGGLNAPGFALDGATCAQANYLLAAGGSCYFVVSFTPTDPSGSEYSALMVLLISAGPAIQTATINLRGSGSEHLAQVSPVGIDFGRPFIGQQVTVPVTFTNTHSAPISFSGGGVSNGPFSADSGNCSTSLAAGSSCSFNYHFTAADEAPAQTTTSVGVSAASPQPMNENFAIALKGQGSATLPAPNIAVWPVTFDFGSITVGQKASVLVYYKNNGSIPLSQAGGGFNDDQGGSFAALSTVVGDCTGSSIPSGAQCANEYIFLPHETRAYTNSTGLLFFDGNGHQLYTPIAVSGIGVGTLARVSPQTIDFGIVAFETNASVAVTITNTSLSPLTNFTGGAVNPPFVRSSGCGASLDVGASCTLTYTFYAPAATAAIRARYTATTLLTFTNVTGIQPIVTIKLSARVGDRLFGDGFDG